MFVKLALRNMTRSLRNYFSYFITIVIAITLMYSFMALASSEDIMNLSDNMSAFKNSIIVLTFFAAILIAFVIGYADDFMIDQRKKEFAVYKVMGMQQKYINRMFYVENLLLFVFAIVIGILLGSLFAEFLTSYLMKKFVVNHHYSVNISKIPVIYTIISCMIMQLISIIRILKNIKHKKIIDLMYETQRNEKAVINSALKQRILFLLALFLFPAGIWLVWYGLTCNSQKAWIYLAIALFSILFSVLRLYQYFPVMITKSVNMMEKWKFKGLNLFLLKQFSSRINSAGKIIAIVAVLLTLSMCSIAGGLFMGASYSVNIEGYAPYDIAIKIDADIMDFKEELTYISEQVDITDYVDYKIYETADYPELPVLAISDYNHIIKQLGLQPVNIGDGEYLIHCEEYYEDEIGKRIKDQPKINLADHQLVPANPSIHTEGIEQYWMAGNDGYAIVVPDSVTKQLSTEKSRLIVSTNPKAPKEMKKELISVVSNHLKPYITEGELSEHTTIGVMVKTWTVANSLTGYTIITFCGLYLGVIFTILVGALLGFQQLAVAAKNKQRYEMLYKMGVSYKEIKTVALKEMLLFFITPVFMPLVVTFSLAGILNYILREQILATNIIIKYTGYAVLVFMLIYSFYIVITFISYRKLTLQFLKK